MIWVVQDVPWHITALSFSESLRSFSKGYMPESCPSVHKNCNAYLPTSRYSTAIMSSGTDATLSIGRPVISSTHAAQAHCKRRYRYGYVHVWLLSQAICTPTPVISICAGTVIISFPFLRTLRFCKITEIMFFVDSSLIWVDELL